jgi:hypothetical protein
MTNHRIEAKLQLGSSEHKAIARKSHVSRGNRLIVALSIGDLIAAQAGATAT